MPAPPPAPPPSPPVLLDQLLERAGDGFELPPLILQQSEGPSLLEKLVSWLSSMFPNRSGGSGDWLAAAISKGLLVLAAMVVLAILYLIFTGARRAWVGAAPGSGRGETRERLSPWRKLEGEIARALEAGRPDLAARLRWRLHLLRRALPQSVTPAESGDFARFYPLMFGGQAAEAAQRDYGELDRSLLVVEGPSHA